jgi:pyrimidine-nucleoside phosphorylase
MEMLSLIEKKKRASALDEEELGFLCREYVAGRVPDYQVAAWLMAVRLNGMDDSETLRLTRAMVATGETLDWSDFGLPVVDKHSTGGVGDKASLVVVPLLAAAGVAIFKMSGRGLGHTGGTLDKLESIPNFRVELSNSESSAQMRRIGCALVGQSPSLVPADKLLYALRDVTATVDSLPLIAASVMSKKLAAGARAIVLDVKYGSGAFMPTIDEARDLARRMIAIGRGAGRSVRALLSPMDEPLGRAVGNSLEVREAIDTLRGRGPADLRHLSIDLGTHLLELLGRSAEEVRSQLTELLDSGAAAERFRALVQAQGGDPTIVDDPDRLPSAPHRVPLRYSAREPAWVERADARTIADVALALGAGRRAREDPIDHAVGVVVHRKVGERCEPDSLLAEVHARALEAGTAATDRLASAFEFASGPPLLPRPSPEVSIG